MKKKLENKKIFSPKIKSRDLTDKMITSHISMIIPCIWWVYTEFNHEYYDQLLDRFMAMIMVLAISFSITYHAYYECILRPFECRYVTFAIVFLNFYMILKKIHLFYIICGSPLLMFLQFMLAKSRSFDRIKYERLHHFCHHIAGLYLVYCIYLVRNKETFSNLNYILN